MQMEYPKPSLMYPGRNLLSSVTKVHLIAHFFQLMHITPLLCCIPIETAFLQQGQQNPLWNQGTAELL